jgi:hypothetical protein
MAAMVVAPNASMLVNSTTSRSYTASPGHHPPQQAGAIFFGLDAGEPDQLIGENVALTRNCELLHHFLRRILLQVRDKIDFLGDPLEEQPVVVVSAIHCYNRAGVEREGVGHLTSLRLASVINT